MNVEMLHPSSLMAVQNLRFGLKKTRVDSLAADITEQGGIHTPLTVFHLPEPGPKGEQYGIWRGHYRHAAAVKLTKKDTVVECPCVIVEQPDDVVFTKGQISENGQRENMSPMDMAIAVKQLVDQGVPKVEIRRLFPRPGGRKGGAVQDLSNAMLNIYLSFLEFPKNIQAHIHDGLLGVLQAYKLSKQPKETWQAIIDEAEAARTKELEAEDKLEAKYLEESLKHEQAEAKAKADREAAIAAQKIAEEAAKTAEARKEAVVEAFKVATAAKGKEEKAKATEALKAKEADAKAAEKAATDSATAAEKLQKKVDEATTKAAERRAQLEAARQKATESAGKKKLDTDKATEKVTGDGKVKLKGPEMYKLIQEMADLNGSFPKVQLIAKSIKRAFDSEITDRQLMAELGYLTGERKQKPSTLK